MNKALRHADRFEKYLYEGKSLQKKTLKFSQEELKRNCHICHHSKAKLGIYADVLKMMKTYGIVLVMHELVILKYAQNLRAKTQKYAADML